MFYNTLALTVLTLLVSNTHGLAVRDTTSDIASTKGGILVKNGKQTSCELGVINSKAAFVAAYCIDFSGKAVNQNTEYEVYLDAGIDNTPAKYSVESITVHPDFNATTGLNPIAVLQFNKDSTETWSNPIAIDRNNSWGDVLFIRRGMTDLNNMEWKTPLTVTNKYTDTTGCTRIPRLYRLNKNDILCSNATTYLPYAYLTECVIPYGSVDVYISGKLYVAGIHAQKVVTSLSSKCRPIYNQNSVFILFADYIAFANKVLGSTISYYPNSNGISPQSDARYSMRTIAQSSYTLALYGVESSADTSTNEPSDTLTIVSSGSNYHNNLLSSFANNKNAEENDTLPDKCDDSPQTDESEQNTDTSDNESQGLSIRKSAVYGVLYAVISSIIMS